jgi:hypothetical protein
LTLELADLREHNRTNKQVGDFAEAVVAGLLALNGQSVLQQHNPADSSHGLDILTLHGDGKIWTYEVKGTRSNPNPPLGTRYAIGRQGGSDYVNDRSRSAHVSASDPDQVDNASDQMGSRLVQVNLTEGLITIWEVDDLGQRVGTNAIESYNLDNIVSRIDREL